MHHFRIETERLVLRPLTVEDCDAVFEWASDEDVARYMVYPTYKSKGKVKEWLLSLQEPDNEYHFGFERKEDRKLIGSGSIGPDAGRDAAASKGDTPMIRKKPAAAVYAALAALLLMTVLGGCGAPAQDAPTEEKADDTAEAAGEENPQADTDETGEDPMTKTLKLYIGDSELCVAWEKNASVEALTGLVEDAPLTVQMSMYGGFEQVGPLGADLPRDDTRITAQAGDIVLYSGDQIVVFYGSNTWAYTRLGRITDKSATELADLLGNGDAVITLSLG